MMSKKKKFSWLRSLFKQKPQRRPNQWYMTPTKEMKEKRKEIYMRKLDQQMKDLDIKEKELELKEQGLEVKEAKQEYDKHRYKAKIEELYDDDRGADIIDDMIENPLESAGAEVIKNVAKSFAGTQGTLDSDKKESINDIQPSRRDIKRTKTK
jgi:hypothetical protein